MCCYSGELITGCTKSFSLICSTGCPKWTEMDMLLSNGCPLCHFMKVQFSLARLAVTGGDTQPELVCLQKRPFQKGQTSCYGEEAGFFIEAFGKVFAPPLVCEVKFGIQHSRAHVSGAFLFLCVLYFKLYKVKLQSLQKLMHVFFFLKMDVWLL